MHKVIEKLINNEFDKWIINFLNSHMEYWQCLLLLLQY